MSQAVGYVPSAARGFVVETGGMAHLLVMVLWSAVRHPRGYWHDVVRDMHSTVKRSWLSITIGIFGFLLALSVTGMQFVSMAGVGEYFGPLLVAHSMRSFTVWVATMLVAGVIGAAMTAELGSRKVREELDAMVVMGVDPIRTLVVPKIVAITLMTTLLAIPAQVITVLSCQFAAWFVGGVDAAAFYEFVWQNQSTVELAALVVNCFVAGLLVGTICSYRGLQAAGGATGLGKAVNQAVVTCFVGLFVMQLGYNAVVLGIFPELGGFR